MPFRRRPAVVALIVPLGLLGDLLGLCAASADAEQPGPCQLLTATSNPPGGVARWR